MVANKQGKLKKDGSSAAGKQCLVCGGDRMNATVELSFQGVLHYFCSERCRRRFSEHPHLYVGSPHYGLSIKQQGKAVVKTHIVHLAYCPDEVLQQKLLSSLQQIGGLLDSSVRGEELTITYDLVCVSLIDIEHEVGRVAGGLKSSLAAKAKRQAIHFAEQCELDNLAHLSSSGKQYGF